MRVYEAIGETNRLNGAQRLNYLNDLNLRAQRI